MPIAGVLRNGWEQLSRAWEVPEEARFGHEVRVCSRRCPNEPSGGTDCSFAAGGARLPTVCRSFRLTVNRLPFAALSTRLPIATTCLPFAAPACQTSLSAYLRCQPAARNPPDKVCPGHAKVQIWPVVISRMTNPSRERAEAAIFVRSHDRLHCFLLKFAAKTAVYARNLAFGRGFRAFSGIIASNPTFQKGV